MQGHEMRSITIVLTIGAFSMFAGCKTADERYRDGERYIISASSGGSERHLEDRFEALDQLHNQIYGKREQEIDFEALELD